MTMYERGFLDGQKSMAPEWHDINETFPGADGNYYLLIEVMNEKYEETGKGDLVVTVVDVVWGTFELEHIDLEYYNYRILYWARVKNLAFPIPMDDAPANLYLV